jgi:predicted DNA-binding protein (MmcQ/YjbR family)
MKIDAFRDFCLSFPEATEKLQWGDNLCFKIREKLFAIASLDTPRLCFKCTPEMFAELIEREDIHAAPYFGRYKWVMLDHLDALGRDELQECVRQSYEMVAANAPEKKKKKGAIGRGSKTKTSKTRASNTIVHKTSAKSYKRQKKTDNSKTA